MMMRTKIVTLLMTVALLLPNAAAAQSRAEIEQTMRRATRFMVERVATYFVMLLNRLAMKSSSPPSAYGQCAAKIS